jgi:Cdc6-like AAA superfamily ATPase
MINKANESYQSIVLAYLDGLPPTKAAKEIYREVKKTYEKSTYYCKIHNYEQDREEALDYLVMAVERFEAAENASRKNETLRVVCDYLDQARKITMVLCEEVTAMFQHYRYEPERDVNTDGLYYLKLFEKI